MVKLVWFANYLVESLFFINQVAMRALGFEPKKEEIKKMISEIDKDGTGKNRDILYLTEKISPFTVLLCVSTL